MAASLFALYLVCGYFVLPAIIKRQIETQVPEKLGHGISVGEVRFNPIALKVEVDDLALFDPKGRPMVGAKRCTVNFELRSAIFRAWTFSHLQLDEPVLYFGLKRDGTHNFAALFERLTRDKPEAEPGALARVVIDRIVVKNGRIDYSDQLLDKSLVTQIELLQIGADDFSTLPSQAASYRLSARTAAGETLEAGGRLAFNPIVAEGKLKLRGLQAKTVARVLSRRVMFDSPTGQIDLAAKFDLAVDAKGGVTGEARDLDLDIATLSLKAAGARRPLAAIESLSLKQGRIDLDRREVTVAGLRIANGFISAILDEQGQIDWAKIARMPGITQEGPATTEAKGWNVSVPSAEVSQVSFAFSDIAHGLSASIASVGLGVSVKAKTGPAGTRVELGKPKLSIKNAALRLKSTADAAKGVPPELGVISKASFGADSLVLTLPKGPINVVGDGLSVTLSEIDVFSPDGANKLLGVGTISLTGGELRLKERTFKASNLTVTNGTVNAFFDSQGRLNWQGLFSALSSRMPAEPATVPANKQVPTSQWHIGLRVAQVDRFAVRLEDKRRSPVFAVGLEKIRARAEGIDTKADSPMQVEAQARVTSGGRIGLGGSIRVDNAMSDLKVKVTELALQPVQTYLSEVVKLRLVSGVGSTEGRLRFDADARAGAKLTYKGKVAVDRVLLEELEPKRPFLAWDSAASGDVALTLAPNRVDVAELQIDRPSGRLTIAADHSVNLRDVLKGAKERDVLSSEDSRADGVSTTETKKRVHDDPFPVTIARVRVSGGALEFADRSLRPQFSARMHELGGVITGLGTDATRPAKLQFDAQVDDHGWAKISGQINVFRPQQFAEIDVALRNLQMNRLSPYVVKFAGREITAGQLALDLQYKVKESQLRGEHKIVLNRVELGVRVDSADALDFPLELAIAVLKDSRGVIDVGLPVSGDLSDPRFDYGAVVGKAIGSLLRGIVTAPFRALGAMFGASDEKFGAIDFEPGSAEIAPPERQKLQAIARALQKRPALRLVVPPTYATKKDTQALKSFAVRADILKRLGVEVAAGEDPGPIDTANPRVQRAVEGAFNERYAPTVLAALKRRAVEATLPAGESAKSGEELAQSSLPAFYQGLVNRLIDQEPVSGRVLAQLAAQRSQAVVHELTKAWGVPATRVALGEPSTATDSVDKAITLKLQLEVAK